MKWGWMVVLLAVVLADTGAAQTKSEEVNSRLVVRRFRAEQDEPAFRLSAFQLSPTVVYDPEEKVIRLARSDLVAEETGATDFHQTASLGKDVLVKKIFVLQKADVSDAELFFYGSAGTVTFNGKPLNPPEQLVSTGFSRVKVPTAFIRAGKNEVIFSGGGQLLLEPGKQPGHSFKSVDGGKTWSREGLTDKGHQQGEYLVRLRLGRFAAQGWARSQVFDLWRLAAKTDIPSPCRNIRFEAILSLNDGQPKGTHIAAFLRTGSTPNPDEKHWTKWHALYKTAAPNKDAQDHRWAQVQFVLTSNDPQQSPRLADDKQALCCHLEQGQVSPAHGSVKLESQQPAAVLRGSVSFVYQTPSPRLKLLRERYKLDEVIAPGQTEMEKLMLLRYWVRNQWHTGWGGTQAAWMPPWDALIILASKDQPDCLTMCTHYAAVYTQCCLALGWNARHCILDHHCVAEVFVNEKNRWVMMDAGNSAQRADVGLHFERNGVPMSARELHLAYHDGQTKDITVCFTPAKLADKIKPLCRPEPPGKEQRPPRPDTIPLAELKKYPVCPLENYRRYAFPARNNYLDTLLPGELYQGWSSYFYDGYCWVGDSPDAPKISPEYSCHLDPRREQDADEKLNWTRIHLSQTDKPGVLRVALETHTPNLARFEKQVAAGTAAAAKAEKCASSFVWQLQPGRNRLRVWSVNHWDRGGPAADVVVQWVEKK